MDQDERDDLDLQVIENMTGGELAAAVEAVRCQSCASEADICIHGVCFGCLAYSLEPARMELQPALDSDDEYVTLRTGQVANVFHAIDTLWAALKPERLKA